MLNWTYAQTNPWHREDETQKEDSDTTTRTQLDDTVLLSANTNVTCADPETFVRRGPTLTTFFFKLMRGEMIQIPLKVGHHQPANEAYLAFHWRADDGPTLNECLVAL